MLLPVRCFTCGSVIGSKQIKYETKLKNGVEPKVALDDMKILRWCCRRMFLGYMDIADQVNQYSEYVDRSLEEKKSSSK